jgi:hypothetical protein
MRDAGKLLLKCFCILILWSCSGQELVVQDQIQQSRGHEQLDAPVQAEQDAKSVTNEQVITCPQRVDSNSELVADSNATHFVVSNLK